MLRSSTVADLALVVATNAHASALEVGSHGIYAGHYDLLLYVENIKPRAQRTEVIGCGIQDSPDGTASYEIQVPNGGSVVVRTSKIIKGPNSENHTAAIINGAESVTQVTPGIIVENNTFRNNGTCPTILVDNLTATEAQLSGNTIPASVRYSR